MGMLGTMHDFSKEESEPIRISLAEWLMLDSVDRDRLYCKCIEGKWIEEE